MTITAHFRRHFLARAAKVVALAVSGTVRLSRVSAFATLGARLGGAERKLVGVVFSELHPAAINLQRDKQYA
jgi:hypothetical protein